MHTRVRARVGELVTNIRRLASQSSCYTAIHYTVQQAPPPTGTHKPHTDRRTMPARNLTHGFYECAGTMYFFAPDLLCVVAAVVVAVPLRHSQSNGDDAHLLGTLNTCTNTRTHTRTPSTLPLRSGPAAALCSSGSSDGQRGARPKRVATRFSIIKPCARIAVRAQKRVILPARAIKSGISLLCDVRCVLSRRIFYSSRFKSISMSRTDDSDRQKDTDMGGADRKTIRMFNALRLRTKRS